MTSLLKLDGVILYSAANLNGSSVYSSILFSKALAMACHHAKSLFTQNLEDAAYFLKH